MVNAKIHSSTENYTIPFERTKNIFIRLQKSKLHQIVTSLKPHFLSEALIAWNSVYFLQYYRVHATLHL